MADTVTTNYSLVKPEVGGSNNSWGTKLSANFDEIDTLIKSVTDAASANTAAIANKADASALSAKADVSYVDSGLSGKSDTGHTHSAVTTSVNGFMSASDKTKLNGIASGANYTPAGNNSLATAGTDTTNRSWDATDLKVAAQTHGGGAWTYSVIAATTSGTAFDFTSLPSGITDLEVFLDRVNGNAGSNLLFQIGTGGSLTTSGYDARSSANSSNALATNGFVAIHASTAWYLSGIFRMHHLQNDIWVFSGAFDIGAGGAGAVSGGRVDLTGDLNYFRLTSVSSMTFNQGSLQIRYK